MSKFLKLVNKVLTEDIGGENQLPAPTSQSPIGTGNTVAPEPTQVSDSSSALPSEEDVNGIDLIKYKTLLKSLRDSLAKSTKKDNERYQLSKLDIDGKNSKEELQFIEDILMGYLNDGKTPENTDWSDE